MLLRVRKFLHETTVDQIPILVDLMRALDEMTLAEPPSAAEARPAYVMEQLPELREKLEAAGKSHEARVRELGQLLAREILNLKEQQQPSTGRCPCRQSGARSRTCSSPPHRCSVGEGGHVRR